MGSCSKKIGSVASVIILTLALVVGAIYSDTWGRITKVNIDNASESINELEDESWWAQSGYTNIVVFGLDNREGGTLEKGNSDVMFIVSINNETKDIKLVPIYRDTLLLVGDEKYDKANSAYQRGGASQALAMINKNLDLTITDYVAVDWAAITYVIDALGGLDIKITKEEKKQINYYRSDVEESTGLKSPKLKKHGLVHLDGVQCTTYARIRKTSGDDFKRSSRQRIVIQKMLEKAKDADIDVLWKVAEALLKEGHIETTLSMTKTLNLAQHIGAFSISGTAGFPSSPVYAEDENGNSIVAAVELDNNVAELHSFLFGEINYQVSATVQAISDRIVEITGAVEGMGVIDTSKYDDTIGKDGTGEKKESSSTEQTTEQNTQN